MAFLKDLAQEIYKSNPSPEGLTIVFPNRRAILYFRKHFSALLDKPVFAPRILTIEEFISSFSGLQVPDKLELIHRLYKAYNRVLGEVQEHVHEPESFDQFYFWGDMLLRDFEEVDKYRVNASQLFKDLSNQKELDAGFDFLTHEQNEFLRDFWGTFSEDLTANKKKFLNVWRLLPRVYETFRKELKDKNLAYEGMLHREVAEAMEITLRAETGKESRIIFAGFNALTTAEENIISHFVGKHNAEVYWDIDQYYLNDPTQEAGRFFRQYQNHSVLGKTFPKDIQANFKLEKRVSILGAAQLVGQTKVMSRLLKSELENGIVPEETLVVLPDEKMLLPVLHGISGFTEKMNVTMGFPLASTPLFNLIELAVELQMNRSKEYFNHRQVVSILGHPYVVSADPAYANEKTRDILKNNRISILQTDLTAGPSLYAEIFTKPDSIGFMAYLKKIITSVGHLTGLTALDKEYTFHFFKLINRMEEVTDTETEKDFKTFQERLKSFTRLFRQVVRSEKIPFTGEPLKGLQVMGVLETRNLDYKNVFVLSLNEGSLPAAGNKPSYIPFNIRKAYALPTTEHQDAFYAYLFYRVLQRAENVFLFYNTETDVLGQGEMSRYLQQIVFESGWKPTHKVLHNDIQPREIKPIVIKKDKSVLKSLAQLNEGNSRMKGISPSALNAYIECGLKFYFRHIARIKEAKEVEEDLDARSLGNLLHRVMELFYRSILDRKKSNLIEPGDLSLQDKTIEQLIDEVFIQQYSLDRNSKIVYAGQRLIVKEIIKSIAKQIIELDANYVPFSIEGLEREDLTCEVPISHEPGVVVIGGKIDRLDRKGNKVRVIDYKTGKDKVDFDSIESLFVDDSLFKKRNKAAFQTMVYAFLYKGNVKENGLQIAPGLVTRMNIFDEEFSFTLKMGMGKEPVNDAGPLFDEFEARLKNLLEEMFDPAQTFRQTSNSDNCKYCPYKGICYR